MLNNYLERDVDRRMERTRRRPIAAGAHPGRAGRSPSAWRWWPPAAWPSGPWPAASRPPSPLLGAAYYVVVYTLLLKPRTAAQLRARARSPASSPR